MAALPYLVIATAFEDESTNDVLPLLPSKCSNISTLLNNGSDSLGVTALLADEYEPCPTAFTAAARNTYAVPFVSPVTSWLAVVEAVRLTVAHDEPLLLEYCTA
jgi:hypothetical protein